MQETPRRLSNEQYIDGLRQRDPDVIQHIYEDLYPGVIKYVVQSGGQREDAEDVFQEGVIVLYRKLDELKLTSSFNTFLFAVCKRIWWKKRGKQVVLSVQDEKLQQVQAEVIEDLEQDEQYTLYREKFKLLGADCQQLLKFFFKGIKMQEIAEKMGYGSVSYAKKRKFVCKEKLTTLIKEDRRYRELRD